MKIFKVILACAYCSVAVFILHDFNIPVHLIIISGVLFELSGTIIESIKK